MKILHTILSLSCLLLLQACSSSNHPTQVSSLGTASSFTAMEALIDQPGPITITRVVSADWSVPLAGLLNLDSPQARQAQLKDKDEAIQIFTDLLKHPQRGHYLIDTGVSAQLLQDPAKFGVNWMLRKGMQLDKMQLKTSTASVLEKLPQALSGVFLTHLHLDHISGLPDISKTVPIYVGTNETKESYWLNMIVRPATDELLANRPPLREWAFNEVNLSSSSRMVIDIFGDGSIFAIAVPGHTKGSTAYLVRSTQGPVLIVGDTSHTKWGWEQGVEPGDYTRDHASNLESLRALKELVARHPAIEVRLGHQH
jgi:glyoxylase-like metal-dependent hydrolase (beta-lactamase superfamily II)